MEAHNDDPFRRVQRKDELSINHLYFYSDTMRELAHTVQSFTPAFSRVGKCDWKWSVFLTVTVLICNSFEDGFPNILLDVSNLPGRHVVFFADLYNPAEMFSQISGLSCLHFIHNQFSSLCPDTFANL